MLLPEGVAGRNADLSSIEACMLFISKSKSLLWADVSDPELPADVPMKRFEEQLARDILAKANDAESKQG
ncbi:hypothetical protein BU26DRAFT_514339, partial [Trematosphaeria pertusa]